MKFAAGCLLAIAGTIVVAGCKKSDTPVASPQNTSSVVQFPQHMDHAQPTLHTIKLWLGSQELITEVATNNLQRNTGMMFREQMGENEAMLFVFPVPAQIAFYMRNTKVPLSCAYIDSEGTILEIHDLKPLDETPVPSNSEQVQYVLEVNQGWFERNKVNPGASIRTEAGTLYETFFRRPGS